MGGLDRSTQALPGGCAESASANIGASCGLSFGECLLTGFERSVPQAVIEATSSYTFAIVTETARVHVDHRLVV